MLLHQSFVVIWVASCTAAAAFHRRGSADGTVPYSNVTASLNQSSVATVSTLLDTPVSTKQLSLAYDGAVSHGSGYAQPTGTGSISLSASITLPNITQSVTSAVLGPTQPASNATAKWTNATSSASVRVSNATCTINVPNASIDYWYPPTYSQALGTMTTKFANYSKTDSYTLVTETATFNFASALLSVWACTWTESYDSEWDFTYTICDEYTDQPTAATTTLVYRSAAAPFPPEGSIAVTDVGLYDLYSAQPVATHPITVAPNRTVNQASATPYVHFTAYEIESLNETKTVQLPSAYAYPYRIDGLEHRQSATGPIPKDFFQQYSHDGCDAGRLEAVVTVLVVVDLYYENWPDNSPFMVRVESSALGFDDPPVVINNQDIRPVAFTMADWDLPDELVKPTPASMKGSYRIVPIPTTPVGTVNINIQGAASNEAQVPEMPQPTQVTIGSVGTIPIIIGPSSVVVVGSQTLRPGQPAVAVGGVTAVSLVPSATALVVQGSTTIQLPQVLFNSAQQPARPPPVLSIGSSLLIPNAATQFFIAPSQTLTPGGTATVDGMMISLAPSAAFVVVGGSTQILTTAPLTPSLPRFVFGSTTITALPVASGSIVSDDDKNNDQNLNLDDNQPSRQADGISGPMFVVGSQLLVPGGQAITASGTTLSLVPGGSAVVINGVTSAVTIPPSASAQPVIALGNSIFTPLSGTGNTFVLDEQTLVAGGQAITLSGTVVSLAPSASFVVVNGATSTLITPASPQVTPPVLSIGSGVFQPLPGSGTSYLIGSSTLSPGGVVVVADTTISLAPSATALIINGRTSIISPSVQPIVTNAPVLTVGSQTYSAVSGTTFVIGGQTLTPGGTVTVSGTTISLAPGATQLVYGSSGRSTTTALFPATTTQGPGVTGNAVPSAGGDGGSGSAIATGPRQGSAASLRVESLVFSFLITALGLFLG